MSDFQQWVAGDSAPHLPVNENFEAIAGASLYAFNKDTTSGLVYGYMGGVFKATPVAGGTTTLADDDDNYVVAHLTTGAITDAVTTTNWDDDTTYARVAIVTTLDGEVTDVVDYRFDEFGLFPMLASGGGGAAARNTSSALATSGSVAIDYALGDYFTLALAGNVSTFTFSNLPGSGKGASLMVRITQDSTPRTVGWPASFKWVAGSAGVVSTGSGAVDVLAITTFDNGTSWQATLANAFA